MRFQERVPEGGGFCLKKLQVRYSWNRAAAAIEPEARVSMSRPAIL